MTLAADPQTASHFNGRLKREILLTSEVEPMAARAALSGLARETDSMVALANRLGMLLAKRSLAAGNA